MENRFAASLVIPNENGLFLLARRGPNKYPYPGIYSLPSTYAREGKKLLNAKPSDELIGGQLRAAVSRKLGIEVELLDVIGEMEGQQASYNLHMRDFIGRIVGGELRPNGKDFDRVGYFDVLELYQGKDRSRMGFCTQVLLREMEIDLLFWEQYV